MTFTHDDIQQRLIDHLYGELDSAARAAFESHLAACPVCRAQVAALREARAAGRGVARAGLDQPVPAGVHARVMEAAVRAARAQLSAQAPASVTAAPGGAPSKVTLAAASTPAGQPSPPGRLAWLRGRWTLPMFATVAAMGAPLLGRETIFREARRPLPPPAAESAPEEVEEVAADERSRGTDLSLPQASAGGPQAPPPTETTHRPARNRSTAKRQEAAPPADGAAARGKGEGQGRSKSKGAIGGGARDDASAAVRSVDGARAQPSVRAVEDAMVSPGKAELSAPDAPARSLARPAVGGAPRPLAPAAAPAAAPAPTPTSARPRAQPEKASAVAPFEAGAAVTEEAGASKSEGADPAVALAQKAEKLMTDASWGAAVTAYRDLLRRFPEHPLATTWRRRLSIAQANAAQATPDERSRFAAPPPPSPP